MKTQKDIEQMLRDTPTPSSELKQQILQRAAEIVPEPTPVRTVGTRPRPRLRAVLAVAIVLALMLGGTLGTAALYFEDYESVYIDINPSVEIVLNRFGRIHKVFCLNEDAQEIFDPKSIRGKNAEDGMAVILDTLEQNGYLDGEAEICISTTSKQEKQAQKRLEQMTKKAQSHASSRGYNANISGGSLTSEEIANARDKGLTPAQLTLIENILELDPTQDREQLEQLPTKELKQLYKLLQRESKR